jgi:hypothetical protein
MGDETVDAVMAFFSSEAFANGIPQNALHPLIDTMVNRLRASGMPDEEIIRVMDDEEPPMEAE